MTANRPTPEMAHTVAPATAQAATVPAWYQTLGTERGDIVTAYERPEKNGYVYLRWTDPVAGGYVKRATGVRVRDAQGTVVKTRVAEVMQQAREARANLRRERERVRYERESGVLAERAPSGRTPRTLASATVVVNGAALPEALRLRDAVERATVIGTGLFATDTSHARDTRGLLARVLTVIDGNTLCSDIRPNHFAELWRELAHRYADEARAHSTQQRSALLMADFEETPPTKRPTGGHVSTGRVVIALARLLRWLQDGGRSAVGAVRPPSNWEARLLSDWQEITREDSAGTVHRPRYTEVEIGKLLLALPCAEPRFRLAVTLGAENRLGPLVLRARRSNLDLTPGRLAPLGQLTIPGRGNKRGLRITLDSAARAAIDAELVTGYLRQLEDLYAAGRLDDYLLFPGGGLTNGVVDIDMLVPVHKRTLNDRWHELEEAAGIPHIEGRGAYGFRRTSTDLVPDHESDTRAQDALFGHTPDDTRGSVYQDPARPEDSAKAAVARRNSRQQAIARAREDAAQNSARESPQGGNPPPQ